MGQEMDFAGGLWDQKERQAHITHLEAAGSANAVLVLCHHLERGDELHLLTNASSTMFSWKKGSKLEAMNRKIQEAKAVLPRQGVCATYGHIPGKDNCRADWLSRDHHKLDPSNYKLKPQVFHQLCRHFGFAPEIDLFASFLNHQLPQYCSGVRIGGFGGMPSTCIGGTWPAGAIRHGTSPPQCCGKWKKSRRWS